MGARGALAPTAGHWAGVLVTAQPPVQKDRQEWCHQRAARPTPTHHPSIHSLVTPAANPSPWAMFQYPHSPWELQQHRAETAQVNVSSPQLGTKPQGT